MEPMHWKHAVRGGLLLLGLVALGARAQGAPDAGAPPAAGPPPAAPPSAPAAASAASAAPAAAPSLEERLVARAKEARHAVVVEGERFSGPGWERLLEEGRASEAFLLGEEHGVAQVPALAGALFTALRPAGYARVAIEISPPLARSVDAALQEGGLEGLRRSYAAQPRGVAFYTLAEEARFLERVRAAVPGKAPVLWGLDYEVGGTDALIARLQARRPAAAREAVDALAAASARSWEAYARTKGPQHIFAFAGDPELVRAVRQRWPRPDAESLWALDTLEETLAINQLWAQQRGWESNARRADLNRSNLLRHWKAEGGRAPKALYKMGAGHLMRGRTLTQVYDVGSLVAEAAALRGGRTFHLLVLGGPGSQHAAFNPVEWTYQPAPASELKDLGVSALEGALLPGSATLIDLRPLRPLLAGKKARTAHPDLHAVAFGFDAVLVLSGSTPSTNL
jgi:hypothetical protein